MQFKPTLFKGGLAVRIRLPGSMSIYGVSTGQVARVPNAHVVLGSTAPVPSSWTQVWNLNQEDSGLTKLLHVPELLYPPKLGTQCTLRSISRLLGIELSFHQ